MTRRNILFLYLKTGGGHISAAKALSQRINEESENNSRAYILDGIAADSDFQRSMVEGGYRFTAMKYPSLWILLYELSRIPFIMNIQTFLMKFYSWKHIAEHIEKYKIDEVVVLHFLLIRPVQAALTKLRKKVPRITIITDPFTVHPLWFYRQDMPVVVFSEKAREYAIRKKIISPESIKVLPPILRPSFQNKIDEEVSGTEAKREARKKLNLSEELPLVLIAGGGEGLPGGEDIFKAILSKQMNIQTVFVAGKNEKQKERVEKIAAACPEAQCRVYGFVDFMFDLMSAADIIITKAGPATIMESLILEKPLILTQYIYGQEKGNVEFVLENGLGFYMPEAEEAAEQIRKILEDPALEERLKMNLRKMPVRNGTNEIADFLLSGDWQ